MNIKQLQNIITVIIIRKRNNQCKPYKLLLIFYVLTLYKHGYLRLFDYGIETIQLLLKLLNSFGPQRKKQYSNMPFWRLKGNEFRQLDNAKPCTIHQKESKGPTCKQLTKYHLQGGFKESTYSLIAKKPKQIDKLAQHIFSQLFLESVQNTIINRFSFSLADVSEQLKPKFCQMILYAYNSQCAVYSYDLMQNCISAELGVAYVKWKTSSKPCFINNDLANYSIHHFCI